MVSKTAMASSAPPVSSVADQQVTTNRWLPRVNQLRDNTPLFHIWATFFFGNEKFIPQIAIAIGVLTSNRREGDEPLWRIGRGTRVPLQGAVDVVPLLGAIVGCHCSVLWCGWGEGDDQLWGSGRGAIAGCHCSVLWRRVTANFGGVDVVPLLGAIVVCYGRWLRGEGDDQLCGSGCGAIAGCHCRAPL